MPDTDLTAPTSVLGRAMPRIYRATDDSATWAAALGVAAAQHFDTLLLPSGPSVPSGLTEAARGLGVTVLQDVEIDRVPAGSAPTGPFTRLPTLTTDPRRPIEPSPVCIASVSTQEDAAELGRWWGETLSARTSLNGVRLLGLDTLPGPTLPRFLAAFRSSAPGILILGWAARLPSETLATLPAHALDLVGDTLTEDGRFDFRWHELDELRRIAPVVVEAGPEHHCLAMASVLAEGWMTSSDRAEPLNALRLNQLSGLPWAQPVGVGPVVSVLRTDAPDIRQSHRAALVITGVARGGTIAAASLLEAAGAGPFHHFVREGDPLRPGDSLTIEPGELAVYTAVAEPAPVPTPLSHKRAETAAAAPRLAIESPSPCVEGGRFPARQVVGTMVEVMADVIGDGHDVLAAVLRWQAPGSADWSEVPMQLVSNDRWTATFPLQRLGLHRYVLEAWKDSFGTFVHELETKHSAGIPITLELREGALLVQAAAARVKQYARAAFAPVLARLERGTADERREALLSLAVRETMFRADDRPNRVTTAPIPVQAERRGAAFASWYEVFPRSMSDDPARHGTFRDVVRHLPRIQAMGFDVLYFPPIHPIGRINRKGPNNSLTPGPDDVGSPYAIGAAEGGHEDVNPDLGNIEDFQHLRMEAACYGIELAIDFAVQCAPDHPWLQQHKDWFTWRPDGTIRYAENPPKKYQDIVNVDFYAAGAVPDLWMALAKIVLYWASQGVRLFRVDNPHTKPLPFWEWMISEVQARYPDTVFLAEAFTRPKVMYRLAKAGFSQSYTYFTWRTTKRDFEEYLTELTQTAPREFFRPHFFVNTPDINPVPLQTAPRQGFLVRAALATTLSGLWGLYSGFELCEATPVPGREEYLDSEKYQIRAWDWDRPGNIRAEIAALNAIRRLNPALQTHLGITFLNTDSDQVLAFEKATPDRSNVVLVAVCVDLYAPHSANVDVPFWRWPKQPVAIEATDLLSESTERWTDRRHYMPLTSDRPYTIWRLAEASV